MQNVEYVKSDSSSNLEESDSYSTLKKTLDQPVMQVASNVEKVNVSVTHAVGDTPYWLSDCLKDAQNMIVEHHPEKPDDKNFIDCAKFFADKIFSVKIQNNGNASGDINLIVDLPSQPSYKICVHDMLGYDVRDNRRMVTIVLVHQLLHAIHPSRAHDSTNVQNGVNRIEREIANRASYHDALLNLESLYQGGKINRCQI
ncbi:MAG: hypothetical protein ACREAR_03155 [Nitrosotalea sp.]